MMTKEASDHGDAVITAAIHDDFDLAEQLIREADDPVLVAIHLAIMCSAMFEILAEHSGREAADVWASLMHDVALEGEW